ncbi:ETC complex I subunit [Roseibium denhamense]|uniref:ETC complex I subunit conserved region n=1 Tax=Roseibium denhamense TaxID=76305 RepID=A0ABY1NQR4_9HYPH|nr:ETC complex I subunit [Roseibium denhamense]MTI08008.1 ETC complex I subunit [Roseibium denhamense]SMP15580.1 ETC complex I subunit conserved region [Roseibium denhamense]
MVARIYRPAKTAMQSGKAKLQRWVLDFEPEQAKSVEPLMGYTSSSDMKQQVRMYFDTQEEAVAYAKRNGVPYRVEKAKERKVRGAAYADNFKFNRAAPWTH